MMEIVLLCIAVLVEIALAGYCIVTRRDLKKLRRWMRIGEFIVFILLVLTTVIVWSFTWALLAVLLFVLGAIATISLIRQQALARPYQTFRIVRNAILMIFAFLIAFIPAIVFPQFKEPPVTGEYKVATKSFTYTDPNRIEEFSKSGKNRQVNVEFWYPDTAEGKYPLVVFSHGANGIKTSNESTFKELASHGYVVCSIDHPYQSLYTVSDTGTVTLISSEYMKEVEDANKDDVYTKEEVYGLIQKWMKLRTDDINFVIDTVRKQAVSGDAPVYQLIDPNEIGVFGHSMGAAASVWIGRERNDVKSVVNLDGPYFSELVYNQDAQDFEASGQAYTTPVLNIYTDDVWKQLDSNSIYAPNRTAKEHFKEVYTVYFKGAKHLSLTDLPLVSPLLADLLQGGKAKIDKYYCIETENQLILQFFDYTLKGGVPFTSEGTYDGVR